MPEHFFKKIEEIVEWHKTHHPESHDSYLQKRKNVKKSRFSGFAKLLRNLDNNKMIPEFLSFLTEFNLADLFISKKVTNLAYEPAEMPDADFVFDDLAISVKNLHPKNYEKADQDVIDKLQAKGGGSEIIVRKDFSSIAIEVKKTEMGTFSWERTETGHSGFLDSDIDEMSAALKYIGEFEGAETGSHKKVLFFFIQSKEFAQYYIQDIIVWYFGYQVPKYPPIFQNDPKWYLKLLKKDQKNGNIDAIIFMYATNTLLSWPPGCLGDVGKEARLQIYTPDKTLREQLKVIFS